MTTFNYDTTRDTDDVLPFTITDENGDAANITSWTLTYVAKRSFGTADDDAEIGPLAIADGITITNALVGTGTLTITAAMKAALVPPVVLRHELKAVDATTHPRDGFTGVLRIDQGAVRATT